MKPHKHAEIIKAWADGRPVQVRISQDHWADIEKPSWHGIQEYRIKPEPKRGWYRVALLVCGGTLTADILHSEESIEQCATFDRWITPRIEYELGD